MVGQEPLIQLYGAREIASGTAILTTESPAAAWSRVGGDALDIGTLAVNLPNNPRTHNVTAAIAAVAGIAVLDLVCARGLDNLEANRAAVSKRTRI
jgi:hypothetical protein